jgi:NTP-dependent ternary system trypsin peptidase co-occuring protein
LAISPPRPEEVHVTDTQAPEVLVQVMPGTGAGREIGFGVNVAERLEARLDDIRRAIASGATAVAESLGGLPSAQGWQLAEVSASFGITLTAEAGALLSKASAGTTFDVTVIYKRGAA